MRKIILICLLVFLGVETSYSQTEEHPANGPRGVKNVRDQLRRRQGDWSSYNNDGDLLSRIGYVNDKREGLTTIYYQGGGPESDKIKEETYYFGGKKDSISIKKYLSGQTSVEGSFEMGKKDGKWTSYYEDGQIKVEGSYKLGKRDGTWKWYNRKGKLVKTASFANGVDSSAPKPAPAKPGDKSKDGKGKPPAPAGGAKTPTPPTPAAAPPKK
jgi:antitoxin component YwqK of YwqJK toxin-antitoxin module